MSWIGGEIVLEKNTKKELNYAYQKIRYAVRSNANCEEFPSMGDNLFPIKQICYNTLPSYEKAIECADSIDWERNYNVLIPFKDVDALKPSKKIINLKERLDKEKNKLVEYKDKTDCKNFKSKLISCPKCGSKINKDYIRNSYCPLCREDLRSDTTKKTIKRYENNIIYLTKEIQTEKEKRSDKAKIKYLILYLEYIG